MMVWLTLVTIAMQFTVDVHPKLAIFATLSSGVA
jgi:hypothetical protein